MSAVFVCDGCGKTAPASWHLAYVGVILKTSPKDRPPRLKEIPIWEVPEGWRSRIGKGAVPRVDVCSSACADKSERDEKAAAACD